MKCTYCEKIFKTHIELNLHINQHTHEKPYKCDQCPAQFSHSKSLHVHKYLHKPAIQCEICHKKFSTPSNLKIHVCTIHSAAKFKCRICLKEYASSQILKYHKKRKHSEGNKAYSCTYCSANFFTNKELISHVRVHTGEKPYKCKFCAKTFSLEANKSRHEKIHTYSCSILVHTLNLTTDLTHYLQ